ncbi:hypothetical protein [Microcoleus sp. PH2017_14_LAR_D_A]|uniref:hypothetical protein n=1 Tax=Microcoleus sp. PH2017_14_LAR_D_A TaxID=2798825 RepID=UPI001DE238BC|nr:hypothetical protein [Microcoleus sp. PH2017_14_LAR_D_A]MCC3487014.1 hypothetical protein [Microcoleus sp. PH2017_14_LAR_D_A]
MLPDPFSIGGKTTLIEEMPDEKIARIYIFELPCASLAEGFQYPKNKEKIAGIANTLPTFAE